MSKPITIRDATPADVENIVRHNAALAMETENKHLDHDTLDSGVRALLADRVKGRYFIAETAGEIAGQLMLTYEWSDWRGGWLWWIQSVYVHPEHRRAGVFRALYTNVVAMAQNEGDVRGIRLYVERGNDPAIRTYESMGMNDAGYLVMETPIGVARNHRV